MELEIAPLKDRSWTLFDNPVILENILLHLSFLELVQARRVSKQWNDFINENPALQYATFRRAKKYTYVTASLSFDSSGKVNPLILEEYEVIPHVFDNMQWQIAKDPALWMHFCPTKLRHFCPIKKKFCNDRRAPGDKEAIKNFLKTSCLDMFCTRPAVKQLYIGIDKKYKDEGAAEGDIPDLVISGSKEQFVTVYDVVDGIHRFLTWDTSEKLGLIDCATRYYMRNLVIDSTNSSDESVRVDLKLQTRSPLRMRKPVKASPETPIYTSKRVTQVMLERSELISEILYRLPFYDLLAAKEVCKTWKDLIEFHPLLRWATFRLPNIPKSILCGDQPYPSLAISAAGLCYDSASDREVAEDVRDYGDLEDLQEVLWNRIFWIAGERPFDQATMKFNEEELFYDSDSDWVLEKKKMANLRFNSHEMGCLKMYLTRPALKTATIVVEDADRNETLVIDPIIVTPGNPDDFITVQDAVQAMTVLLRALDLDICRERYPFTFLGLWHREYDVEKRSAHFSIWLTMSDYL